MTWEVIFGGESFNVEIVSATSLFSELTLFLRVNRTERLNVKGSTVHWVRANLTICYIDTCDAIDNRAFVVSLLELFRISHFAIDNGRAVLRLSPVSIARCNR